MLKTWNKLTIQRLGAPGRFFGTRIWSLFSWLNWLGQMGQSYIQRFLDLVYNDVQWYTIMYNDFLA